MLCQKTNTQSHSEGLVEESVDGPGLKGNEKLLAPTENLEEGQEKFVCQKCSQELEISLRIPDRNVCRPCRNVQKLDHYYRTRSERLAYSSAYKKRPEVRKRTNERKRKASKRLLEEAKKDPEKLKQLRAKRWNAQLKWKENLRIKNPEKYAEMVADCKAKDAHRRRVKWASSQEFRQKQLDWFKKRRLESPEFRLAQYVRNQINSALRGRTRSARAFELIGCTLDELKSHLEQQFVPGMAWINWGAGESDWQIDHHRPLASYDLSDPEQQKQAFSWKNLKPEWARVNSSKSSHWNGKFWRHTDHTCQPPPTP